MNRLTGAGVQVLMKTTWALAVVVAMWLLSKGILASWQFEPTAQAVAQERRGDHLMLAAAVILAVCAALAHVALHAPPWAVAAIASGAVAVWVAVSVSALSFAVLLAYPAALAGLAGCLSFSRWPAP